MKDVRKAIGRICPEMLTNDNFMSVVNKYCNGEGCNPKSPTEEESNAWNELHEVMRTATVGQVIRYLKENFSPTDKLCYMDCVEGYKNDCTYVTKGQLGQRFFYYVKDLRSKHMERCDLIDEQEDDAFPYVDDNDVVVC